MHPQLRSALLITALASALVACNRGQDAAAPAVAPAPAEAVPAVAAPAASAGQLSDVLETSASMVVGITYPKGLEAYPGLVKVLTDYSQQRRDELKREVEALGNDQPEIAYDLTLSYQKLAESPDLVAVAADGDLYTGGAHGQPLVMRYVWLPKQSKLLTAGELIPTAAGWTAVSAYAREQLKLAAQERIMEDKALTPEEVARLLSSDSKSIDEGAAAKVDNFEQFEPLLDANQKVRGLRFVFPPYQIGPYAYGVQSVDVPADVLRPHVAAGYQDLFAP
jgi:hypothetical protein